jgi:hypothetical protein
MNQTSGVSSLLARSLPISASMRTNPTESQTPRCLTERQRLWSSLSTGERRFVSKTTARAAQIKPLPFLKTVKHQLHARRHPQFVEDAKKIISYDLLLARGCSPVQVALFCYIVAVALAGISWKERGMSPAEASAVSVFSFAALAVVEVRLGSLEVAQNTRRPVGSVGGVSNKRAPTL